MKAKIVVGLGFGDEGKGITTDYLATKYPNSVVVRYTGGHQAGHNVVINGVHHNFSSYGSGTFRGSLSYLSEHCCFYPPNMAREFEVLVTKSPHPPVLVIHPLAKLTTPYDVAFNRLREARLKHGSCGIGIGTTMARNQGPYKLHAIDSLCPLVLDQKLAQIKKYYESLLWEFNAVEIKHYSETVKLEFMFWYPALASGLFRIEPYDFLGQYKNIIFEGAQGLLLDMDLGVFPNVTYGHTSSRNAFAICNLLNISDIEMYYVTRCYLTRHGSGWMPSTPVTLINNEFEDNVNNDWQGQFRTSELDYNLLNYAMLSDNTYSYGRDKHLVVTCLDQRPNYEFKWSRLSTYTPFQSILGSYSRDSKDFTILNLTHV